MESIQIIQKALGDNAMSTVQISVAQMLQRCSGTIESDPHSGGPATSRTPENVEHAWAAINKDWQMTGRELEADLGFQKLLCLRF